MRIQALACLRRAAVVAAVAMASTPVHAALFLVATPAELTAAVDAANATPGADTIRFTADITVTSFPAMPDVTTPLTLDGNGHKLTNGSGLTIVNVIRVTSAGRLRMLNLTFEGWGYSTGLIGAGGTGLVTAFAPIEVIGCTFINNRPSGGPLLNAFGSARIIASRFEANEGQVTGQPLLIVQGGGEVVNSVFHANFSNLSSPTDGSPVATIYGPGAVVRQTTFSNNVIGFSSLLSGTMQVDGSTFSNNVGSTNSRVIGSFGNVAVNDSTITGNAVARVFYTEVPGTIAAGNVTIRGNMDVGSAPPFGTGMISVTNSLLSGNSGGNCSFVATQANNASDDASCAGAIAVTAGVDFAAAAAANGGPTQTHALLAGSAAIDASGAGATNGDQRGRPRTGVRDIGAFESGVAPTYPTVEFAGAGTLVPEGPTLSASLTVTGAANFNGIARVYMIDTESGTASLGTDYVDGGLREVVIDCSSGTCPATVTFNLATATDASFEGNETVIFRIVATDGLAIVGPTSTYTVTILDPATVTIAATDASATENPADNGRFTVDLGRVNGTGAPITVNYAVTGTATAGVDYAALAGSVVIPAGQQTATIDVVPIDDAIQESAETVVVTLTGTSHPNAAVSGAPASVTIVDGLEFPGVPTGLAASGGVAQATLTFGPPASDGGSAITLYNASCTPGPFTVSGPASPLVVGSLAHATTYACTVSATNAVGTGVASAAVNVTTASVPGAPVIGSAIAGDGQAAIAFTPPASNGGSAITGYAVTCLPSGSGSGPASPIVVSGLANGTAYTCSVKASNVVGTGAASATVAVTPVSIPGAPSITAATPGNGQAVITFTPPVSTGGSPITGYTASCGAFSASGAVSPLTVTGLTNGTAYACTVTATTLVGIGPASPSASVTPRTVPGAPASVIAASGDGMATITFGAPASDGGAAISSYTATCSPGAATASGPASPLTITGLANNAAYSCSVTATNVAGTGPASASAGVTPGSRTYTGPSATGSGTITASFTGGGATCFFSSPQFIPLAGHAASPPAGSGPPVSFPHGLFDFRTVGCTPGATITMSITYPAALVAGTPYWKYGPEPGNATPHWYVMPSSTAGTTVTFSITDGMQGDDDLAANGTIVDQGGPGVGAGAGPVQVPTLSQWALLVFALLMLAMVVPSGALRKRGFGAR